jgi:hypothetical protein
MAHEMNTETNSAEKRSNCDATGSVIFVHIQCVTSFSKDSGCVVMISRREKM